MKIVNRKEFLKFPQNTLFMKYEPCFFSSIYIKGDTWTNDFLVQHLDNLESKGPDDYVDKCKEMEQGGSVPLDLDCMSRDGLFEEEQLFAVFEKEDVKQLIKRLEQCL